MPRYKQYDIAIVGGGPAGSSTAYHASKLGLKTILFEKKEYPRDKPCGGALSTRNLNLIGEETKNTINSLISEMRLYSPNLKFFREDREKGYFIIRSDFDAAMARDAQNAGCEIITNSPVTNIEKDVNGVYKIISPRKTVLAKYVILATGVQNNKLIKKLNIRKRWPKGYLAMTIVSETKIDNSILTGCEITEPTLAIMLGIVPKGYGWFFVKDGYINIGIGATWLDIKDKNPKEIYNSFVQLLRDHNFIPESLELARSKSHTLVFKKPAKRTVFDNLLLVGDAAGFVSPVTGEGLYYAIKSGELAAKTIYNNLKKGSPLSHYEKAWKKDFGGDLMKYGVFIQNTMYHSLKTMELAVTLGRHDKKMARMIAQLIYGKKPYGKLIFNILVRLPITLLKIVF